MARSLLIGKNPQLSVPMEVYFKRNKLIWGAQNVASTECNLKVINPLTVICNENECDGYYKGRPIFYDDNHLSNFGAEKLKKIFEPIFK